MKKQVFLLFAALLLSISPLQAQSSTSTSSASETDPVPYDLEAIPEGVLESSEYIPLVGTAEITNNEKMYTVGVTFSLAFIVATVDMILYKKKQREERSGEARRLRVRQAEELYGGIDSNFTPQPADTLTVGENESQSNTTSDEKTSPQTDTEQGESEESSAESGSA